MTTGHHHVRRRYRVTVLRVDGTPWIIEHAKHVLFKSANFVEIYLGEHNVDRNLILIPLLRIDHIYVEEENP